MNSLKITPLDARTYMHVKLVGLSPLSPQVCPRDGSPSGERGLSIGSTGLPTKVGTIVPGLARILCLAPGEWLLTSAARSIRNLMEHIAVDLPDGLVIVDVSDGLSALEIEGCAARELLSKGCGLDLHRRIFLADRCARTRFAQIPVIIDCLVPAEVGTHGFHLYFARSYFAYLHSWLMDAAIEFEEATASV